MRERGWGRVVAITSIAVRQPIETLILSNTAPHWRDRVPEVARPRGRARRRHRELGAARIARHRPVDLALRRRHLIRGTQGSRPASSADPDDFGAIVAFVCSEHAKFLTGAAIWVDGGAYGGLQ